MEKLKINEIFHSIQGEGIDVGKPCVFVRFAGCNLKCAWCDTDFEEVSDEMSAEELIRHIEELYVGEKYIVLTGGEPLIQNSEEFERLCLGLRGKGFTVAVETNGTISPDKFDAPRLMFNLMAISPKLGSAQNKLSARYTHGAKWSNMTKVQIKFVIASKDDMTEALKYLHDYKFSQDTVVVFQPEASTGTGGYFDMIRYFEDEVGFEGIGFEVRFLPQVHKLLDIK